MFGFFADIWGTENLAFLLCKVENRSLSKTQQKCLPETERRPGVSGWNPSACRDPPGRAAHRQLPTHPRRAACVKHPRVPGLQLPDAGSTRLLRKGRATPRRGCPREDKAQRRPAEGCPAGGRRQGPPRDPEVPPRPPEVPPQALRSAVASGLRQASHPLPTSPRTWVRHSGFFAVGERGPGTCGRADGSGAAPGRTAAGSPRVPPSGPAARRVLTQIAEAPGEEPAAVRATAPASSRGGFDLPGRAASTPFPEGECAPPAPRPAPHIVAGMPPPLQACLPRVSGPGFGPAATGPARLSHHCRSPNPPAPGSRAQTQPSPSIPFFVTPPRHNLEVPSTLQGRADVRFRLAENLVFITKFPTNALNGIKNRSLLFVKEKKNPALRKIERLVLSSI